MCKTLFAVKIIEYKIVTKKVSQLKAYISPISGDMDFVMKYLEFSVNF